MKIVTVLSGGLDSSTLLHFLNKAEDGSHEVAAISFNYGQRHSRELEFAKWQADSIGAKWKMVDLSSIATVFEGSGSSLVDKSVGVPLGHYAGETMKATVVPNRNMIMLSVATAWAISIGYDAIAYAAHSGDHAIYPDCRPEFASHLSQAIKLSDWKEIKLLRPFVGMSKADIAKMSFAYGVDTSKTWSCYNGRELHCGNCGTCVERREAFHLAGVKDPTQYEKTAKPLDEMLRVGA